MAGVTGGPRCDAGVPFPGRRRVVGRRDGKGCAAGGVVRAAGGRSGQGDTTAAWLQAICAEGERRVSKLGKRGVVRCAILPEVCLRTML